MITPAYARLMAAYNRWQNEALLTAAETLDDTARRADRGAFFGSIHGTLCHLLWGDQIWLSRLGGAPAPAAAIQNSATMIEDWAALCEERRATDRALLAFADGLDAEALSGSLRWTSASTGADVEKPVAELVVHLFNHQTHHRGQLHALLTAAGAPPYVTDLFRLPGA